MLENIGNLILARRIGETVTIGDSITVTISKIVGHQAYLAIRAPRDLEVHRQEIWEKIQAEKENDTDLF